MEVQRDRIALLLLVIINSKFCEPSACSECLNNDLLAGVDSPDGDIAYHENLKGKPEVSHMHFYTS